MKVLTDHKGLEYFITTKKLTPRQARWAEFLSKFNFVVTYQTGKKNEKADALTRKPNEQPISNEDYEHKMQVLLLPERLNIQPIEVTNKTSEPHAESEEVEAKHDESVNNRSTVARDKSMRLEGEEGIEARHKGTKTEPHAESHAEPEKSVETKDLNKELEDLPTLPDWVKKANRRDALFTEVREYLANLVEHNRPTVYLRGSRVENGLLYKDNKLWVTKDLRLDVIREVHDQPAVRHAGVRCTILLIQQHFFWSRMKRDMDQYNHGLCDRSARM